MGSIEIYEAVRKQGKAQRRAFRKVNERLDAQDAAIVALAVAVSKLVTQGDQDAAAEAIAQDLNKAADSIRAVIPATAG